MKLKKHCCGICDVESWENIRPPKKGKLQWKKGRSAMEFANYITKDLPDMPEELEKVLGSFVPCDAEFDWDAEYVTNLPGRGEGRNHDGILYNDELFVSVEAKADESFGKLIGEELKNARDNKKYRVDTLLNMFKLDNKLNICDIRYQLLTAAAGTLIEAEAMKKEIAIMFVLVFNDGVSVESEKIERNNADVYNFLKAFNAIDKGDYYVIPNNINIDLYFKKIEIVI